MNLTRIKEASKEFVKVLRYGKSDVQTADNIAPHGLDSKPVKEDLAIYAKTKNTNQGVFLGVLKNFSKTKSGETRLFATNNEGKEVFEIFLTNDGVCNLGGDSDFMVRYSELEKAYNEVRDKLNEVIEKHNSHTHVTTATIGATTTPGVISPTTSQQDSCTGDISGAKIDNIKTN